MSISDKIKTINYKIDQNKTQYNVDRQTAMISTLLSGNVSKCQSLIGKDVLPGKDLLGKAAAIKSFEYSPLGKELIKQTSFAEKQYQSFDKVLNHDGKKKERPWQLTNQVYSITKKYSFIELKNVGENMDDSLVSLHKKPYFPDPGISRKLKKIM